MNYGYYKFYNHAKITFLSSMNKFKIYNFSYWLPSFEHHYDELYCCISGDRNK